MQLERHPRRRHPGCACPDRAVIITNNLTFNGTTDSWQGLLDMNTNDMIVHAAGSATLFPNITNQIKEGFNGGTDRNEWNHVLRLANRRRRPLGYRSHNSPRRRN